MSGSGSKGFPFAKIVVVLAIAFGVGVGLCGISFVVAAHGFQSHEEFGVDSIGIANISLVVMVVSAVALVPALLAWLVAAIVRNAKSGSEPQKLLSSEETEEPEALPGDQNDEQKPL
jgi:hypothetical protein